MKRTAFLVFLLLSCPIIILATKPFTFALLSDLHVSASKPQSTEDLQNAVNEINANNTIEFVLVSGDIVVVADSNSYKIAKGILDQLKAPHYITTGNHDYNFKEGGLTNFCRVFGSEKFSFTYNNFIFVGFPTGPIVPTGNAMIDVPTLKWVKMTLKKNSRKHVFAITHYPLQKGDVDNRNEIIDVLHKYKTQAVLNGHYHRNVVFNYDGIPGIVNRSTLRGADKVGGYSIYTVSDSLTVYEKKIGQPATEWFAMSLLIKK